MFGKNRLVSAGICLGIGLSFVLNGSVRYHLTCAAPEDLSEPVVALEISEAEQQKLLSHWTIETRDSARPLAFPIAEVEPEGWESSEIPTGEPGFEPGGAPDPRASQEAALDYAVEWERLKLPQVLDGEAGVSGLPDPKGKAGVFTGYPGNYFSPFHLEYPYQAVGRLYIVGGDYCTAAVAGRNNTIVTAAHCVYDTDTNRWRSGWVFVPADRAGAAPYGVFPARVVVVLGAWINASDSLAGRPYDIAVIKLGPNSVGRGVTFYTGWLGRSWNLSYKQNFHALGYPSNLSEGRFTYLCTAESFRERKGIVGMGCNMMDGSGGSPWIRCLAPYNFRPSACNCVNSVVSGGLRGPTLGNTFYGPYFSDKNIVPLCTAIGC